MTLDPETQILLDGYTPALELIRKGHPLEPDQWAEFGIKYMKNPPKFIGSFCLLIDLVKVEKIDFGNLSEGLIKWAEKRGISKLDLQIVDLANCAIDEFKPNSKIKIFIK